MATPAAPDPATPATLTLAMWATDVAHPVAGLDAWVADVDARLAECAAAGVDLVMLPEYACLRWLTFAPDAVPITGEAAWLAGQAEAVLPRLPALARRHGVALLAGTMPAAGGGGELRNRAHLFLPDGRHVAQDKLCLTPIERDAATWARLAPGDRVAVVAWRGLRLAVVVCLDVEQPALAARLQPLDLDLVLVPSMTSRPSGHHRVFDCAKARAVELMCPVAVVGTVGTQVRLGEATTNVGGAAVFMPCEAALGSTGVHAWLDPTAGGAGAGPLLVARGVPVGAARRLRRSGLAEAWPGPWDGAGVAVVEGRPEGGPDSGPGGAPDIGAAQA